MIVKMKKAVLLTLKNQLTETLLSLQDFGVLHIRQESSINPDIEAAQSRLKNTEKALIILENLEGEGEENLDIKSEQDLAQFVLNTADEIGEIKNRIKNLDHHIAGIGPWNNISTKDIQELEEAGIPFRLYECTEKEYGKHYKDKKNILTLRIHPKFYLVQIGNWEPPLEGLKALAAPEKSDSDAEREMEELYLELGKKERILLSCKKLREEIEGNRLRSFELLEFEKAKASFSHYDEVVSLTGFIPVTKTASLQALCQKEGVGIILQDPTTEDPVPTLIENNKAVGIIKPVFDFLGTVPGYWEKDVSLWFLIFFSVFFGIIIGDAGYGALILLGTAGFHLSMKVKGKKGGNALALTYVLSITTMVWGGITGNWFGSSLILKELPFLQNFVIPSMNSMDPAVNSDTMVQMVCFWIAVIHLSIAQFWNFLNALKSPYKLKAIAELGWMSMNVGLFNIVMGLVTGNFLFSGDLSTQMIIAGFAVVFIFSNQQGNFLKGLASSGADIITLVLSGINAFSDLVSYIRLFAVGLASLKIAESFNTIAGGFSDMDPWVAIPLGILVLLLGHGLNLIMGMMSVLVHGIRLNLLEFSGRLGLEWSGMPYHPFKRWLLKTEKQRKD